MFCVEKNKSRQILKYINKMLRKWIQQNEIDKLTNILKGRDIVLLQLKVTVLAKTIEFISNL